eukprot:2193832-Karenia_brevis.AAC.1
MNPQERLEMLRQIQGQVAVNTPMQKECDFAVLFLNPDIALESKYAYLLPDSSRFELLSRWLPDSPNFLRLRPFASADLDVELKASDYRDA